MQRRNQVLGNSRALLGALALLALVGAAGPGSLGAAVPVRPPLGPRSPRADDQADPKVEAFMKAFAEKHPARETVRIDVRNMPAGDDAAKAIVERLTSVPDAKADVAVLRHEGDPAAMTVAMAPVANPGAVADAMTFGRVTGEGRAFQVSVFRNAKLAPLWQTFQRDEDGFAVDFPGKPRPMRREGVLMFVVATPQGAYLVNSTPAASPDASAKVLLDNVQAEAFGEGTRVLESKDIALEGGIPGRAVVGRDREDDYTIARYYIANGRLYQALLCTPSDRRAANDTERFFGSLKLFPPKAAPAPTKEPADANPDATAKPPDAPKPPDDAAKAEPPKTPDPQPPEGADDLTVALTDLESSDPRKVKAGAERIAKMPVAKDRQDEVAKALAAALASEDGYARASALKALGVWYVPAVLPDMVKRLQDASGLVRAFAFDALAGTKDVRAAEAIAARLPDDRGRAAKALKAMGPLAEPTVLKYLKHADPKVRVEAIRVLGEVGTAKSLPALKPLTAEKDLSTRAAAERAVKAIAGRR